MTREEKIESLKASLKLLADLIEEALNDMTLSEIDKGQLRSRIKTRKELIEQLDNLLKEK